MGEQWYKHWQTMGKKAKFKTSYQEPVYPAEFRTKSGFPMLCLMPGATDVYFEGWMMVMFTGWVQEEVHVQWGYQSLQ